VSAATRRSRAALYLYEPPDTLAPRSTRGFDAGEREAEYVSPTCIVSLGSNTTSRVRTCAVGLEGVEGVESRLSLPHARKPASAAITTRRRCGLGRIEMNELAGCECRRARGESLMETLIVIVE
jgi:hypothetical protein